METKHWTMEIDAITETFKQEFGYLTEQQLNYKPDKHTWSIGQNIDHLIIINSTYFPLIKRAREDHYTAPWLGRFDFITDFIGKSLIKAVGEDRKKKTKTFTIWEPSKELISLRILTEFEKHQNELKQIVLSSSDLLKKQVVISSPASKNIVYKLSSAFDIIVAHEKRHLNQAKELLKYFFEGAATELRS